MPKISYQLRHAWAAQCSACSKEFFSFSRETAAESAKSHSEIHKEVKHGKSESR